MSLLLSRVGTPSVTVYIPATIARRPTLARLRLPATRQIPGLVVAVVAPPIAFVPATIGRKLTPTVVRITRRPGTPFGVAAPVAADPFVQPAIGKRPTLARFRLPASRPTLAAVPVAFVPATIGRKPTPTVVRITRRPGTPFVVVAPPVVDPFVQPTVRRPASTPRPRLAPCRTLFGFTPAPVTIWAPSIPGARRPSSPPRSTARRTGMPFAPVAFAPTRTARPIISRDVRRARSCPVAVQPIAFTPARRTQRTMTATGRRTGIVGQFGYNATPTVVSVAGRACMTITAATATMTLETC